MYNHTEYPRELHYVSRVRHTKSIHGIAFPQGLRLSSKLEVFRLCTIEYKGHCLAREPCHIAQLRP